MIEIRLLLPGDNREDFSSGDLHLDNYFRRYAGQNQFRHRIGANYVAIDGERLCGFVTVCPAQIETEKLKPAAVKRLPAYPVPVLRLARLAIGRDHQGKGIGEALLRYVFTLARRTSRDLGCAGVVVDAKPTAVDYYKRFGFQPLEVTEGGMRDAPVAMFLGIRSIPEE